MIVTTSRKIAVARALSRVVIGARAALGKGPQLDAVRGGLRWRLDLREGVDLSIFLLGGFEPSTLRLYRRLVREGDCALDIGANVGSHTLPLARLVGARGRVHAFEPTAYAFGKLRANVALNPALAERIEARQLMLQRDAATPPAPSVYSSWPLEKAGDLHEKHLGRLMSTTGAEATTLDRYVSAAGLHRVDFVKIDVDGGEPDVIAGGAGTLERFRPPLLMEFAPYLYRGREALFQGMLDLLSGLGYTFADADSGAPLRADYEYLSRLIPDGATGNVVARVR